MTYNATDNHSEPTSHHNPSFTKKYCFNIWQEVKFKFAHCFPDNSWETFSKFPTLFKFCFFIFIVELSKTSFSVNTNIN